MGIYDRDYYRGESNRWGMASEHRGVIALIALTTAFSLAGWLFVEQREIQLPGGERFVTDVHVLEEAFEFRYPAVIPGGQVWRLVTSFFVSDAFILWFVFAMLFLYFLGGEMEILYGTRRFVTFYLLAGLIANVVKVVIGLGNVGVAATTVGTAAPMFATLVLFAFHYPHRQIRVFFFLPVPVWLLVTLYLGLSLLGLAAEARAAGGNGMPRLAEPLVGAVVGFAYYRTRGGLFGFVESLAGALRRRPRVRRSPAHLRVYDDDHPTPEMPQPASAPAPRPTGGRVDEHLEAKLDEVLAKVARHGKGSLTAEENDILLRASEVFKRKRS